jgi:hypothetical protein
MGKTLVLLTGWFFVLYGFAFALAPIEMSHMVTGGVTDTLSGVIDVRATYGGMSIAVGVVLLLLAKQSSTLSLSLLATAVVLLAMAAGRLLGMVLDGEPNSIMYVYLGAELLVGTAAIFLRKSVVSANGVA